LKTARMANQNLRFGTLLFIHTVAISENFR